MSSGVAVADECKAIFEEIKKSKKYRYCIFHIKDEKVISVEEKGDRDASYDAFLNDLQKAGDGECRYGLYDFEYEHQCQVMNLNELPHMILRFKTILLTRSRSLENMLGLRLNIRHFQGTTESSKKQKLFLMNWCPDSAKIKKKMLYASSFDNLKKSLVGVHKFIQVGHGFCTIYHRCVFRQQTPPRHLKARWKNSCAPLTGSKNHPRANGPAKS